MTFVTIVWPLTNVRQFGSTSPVVIPSCSAAIPTALKMPSL
jgi:hypothetical protein